MKILLSGNIDFPEDVSLYAHELYRKIREAKKSIKVVSYVIYDDMFWKQLEGKFLNFENFKVNLIIDKNGLNNTYEKINSLKHKFPKNFFYKVYKGGNKSLHAKFIIFDDKEVIIGSHNITQKALFNNIELAILIDELDKVNVILDIFNKIWRKI